jgi:hypothetical protein
VASALDNGLAGLLARGLEFASRTLGKPLHPSRRTSRMRAQRLARVPAPALSPEPLLVQEMDAGQMDGDPGASRTPTEPLSLPRIGRRRTPTPPTPLAAGARRSRASAATPGLATAHHPPGRSAALIGHLGQNAGDAPSRQLKGLCAVIYPAPKAEPKRAHTRAKSQMSRVENGLQSAGGRRHFELVGARSASLADGDADDRPDAGVDGHNCKSTPDVRAVEVDGAT